MVEGKGIDEYAFLLQTKIILQVCGGFRGSPRSQSISNSVARITAVSWDVV